MHSSDDLICAVLRGEEPPWPKCGDDAFAQELQQRAAVHGVQTLLHAGIAGLDWPSAAVAPLRQAALAQTMWELRHAQLLSSVLERCHTGHLQPVLFKGSALAYTLFRHAAMRSRGDTDLLIRPTERDQLHRILASLCFTPVLESGAHVWSTQATYAHEAADGTTHLLDVHWALSNSPVLAKLLTHEELIAAAQPVLALCDHAVAAGRLHALLIACMHRLTHRQNPYHVDGVAHFDANRLIWLYDIHLLGRAMSAGEWEAFAEAAASKRVAAVCADGIEQAARRFGQACPDAVLAVLKAKQGEHSAKYFASGKLRQSWMDFRAVDGWRSRARVIREVLFPPARYMLARYAGRSGKHLPWLYAKRAATGLVRTARQSSARRESL